MSRLDEIKARQDARDRWNEGYGGLRSSDVRTLIEAVEAVLALHTRYDDFRACRECDWDFPCPTVTAIRAALGETDA